MKNENKLIFRTLGIIALAAIIGLVLTGCPNPGDDETQKPRTEPPQSVTYISTDSEGNIYTLVVTENTSRSARYAAKNGDSFTFTVELFNSGNYTVALTYSGKINSVGGDETAIELNITVNGEVLHITISGTTMTVISGKIVLDNREEMTITETLTSVTDKRALELVINAANAAKEGVVTSTNGADVLSTVYWVSETRMDVFITAIANAQAVYYAEDSEQSLVNSERNKLTAAITVFNTQKRLGTKIVDEDNTGNNLSITNVQVFYSRRRDEPANVSRSFDQINPFFLVNQSGYLSIRQTISGSPTVEIFNGKLNISLGTPYASVLGSFSEWINSNSINPSAITISNRNTKGFGIFNFGTDNPSFASVFKQNADEDQVIFLYVNEPVTVYGIIINEQTSGDFTNTSREEWALDLRTGWNTVIQSLDIPPD